jgi:hypothetical protein
MTDEIRVRYDDGYGWGVATDIKAAELFLSLYKETGDEYQKERAENLADRVAKTVNANPCRDMGVM